MTETVASPQPSSTLAPIGLAAPGPSLIQPLIDLALAEDLAWGDMTTDSVVGIGRPMRADLLVKGTGVLAGLAVARQVFLTVDPTIRLEADVADGTAVTPGVIVGRLAGPAGSLLKGERVALNLLQRLSGIASLTANYVAQVAGTRARIIDTRKTIPGLRVLEKYAVRAGGGHNHRFNLADGILIKDNHLLAAAEAGLTLGDAISRARQQAPHTMRIEVEVDNLTQLQEALAAGADAVLLDNMSVAMLREAVALVAGRAITEASGGINLTTVRAVAETGVDLISVGALTHSVTALDISLDFHANG